MVDLSEIDDANDRRVRTARATVAPDGNHGDGNVLSGNTCADTTISETVPEPLEIFEIFDPYGKIRSDFTDAQITSLSTERREIWAALMATSIEEKDAETEMASALSDVAAKSRAQVKAEMDALALREGGREEELADNDKMALTSNNVAVRSAALVRASLVAERNRIARVRRLENTRIDEVRRAARANSTTPVGDAFDEADVKAQAEQAAKVAEAEAITTSAEFNLNAARIRLGVAQDEQRRARGALATAISNWQSQSPKTHLDLVRDLSAASQQRLLAIATGALVEPARPLAASKLDEIMQNKGRGASTRRRSNSR